DLARTAEVRSDAIHRGGATQPASVRLGAFRRRRAYVPRPAFRLYAGQVLCTALPAKPRSFHEPRLQAGLADMADPQAARRPAGDGEAGLTDFSEARTAAAADSSTDIFDALTTNRSSGR